MTVVDIPFELVVVGAGIEVSYPLSRQTLTIGRSRAAMPDIEIIDVEAAPRHCVLQWNNVTAGHALRVFGETGAWLNGRLLAGDGAVHSLAAGDEFRIGATVFKYRSTVPAIAVAGQIVDVPTVHAAPTTREVYEFEVIPRIAAGEFDWKHPMVTSGPRHRLEAPMQAVRVVITKGTPRDGVAAALKQIAELVDGSASAGEHSPAPLAALANWFGD